MHINWPPDYGLKNSNHVDNADLFKSICLEIFTGYPKEKVHVKFPRNCCVAQWLRVQATYINWPQNLGPPLTCGKEKLLLLNNHTPFTHLMLG